MLARRWATPPRTRRRGLGGGPAIVPRAAAATRHGTAPGTASSASPRIRALATTQPNCSPGLSSGSCWSQQRTPVRPPPPPPPPPPPHLTPFCASAHGWASRRGGTVAPGMRSSQLGAGLVWRRVLLTSLKALLLYSVLCFVPSSRGWVGIIQPGRRAGPAPSRPAGRTRPSGPHPAQRAGTALHRAP